MIFLARAGAFIALFAACTAAAAAQPAAAASPSPTPSPIPEIGRVVTSDRRPEAATNATRPTFVVDRSAIESFGSRTVADALANVPGVGLVSYGAFGAQVNYAFAARARPRPSSCKTAFRSRPDRTASSTWAPCRRPGCSGSRSSRAVRRRSTAAARRAA